MQKAIEAHSEVVKTQLNEVLPGVVSAQVQKAVSQLAAERAATGTDRTGLTLEQKKEFVELVKNIATGKAKANEALIPEDSARGGYLIPTETYRGILRIAESFGLVMNQATKFPMSSTELEIPAYTGSVLEGEYLGVDAAGSVTALGFEQARLIKKTWQVAFVLSNVLVANAVETLADFLMALVGEALANQVDKQALNGTGAPFVGIMQTADVATVTMGSGDVDFNDFDLEDASDMIAAVPESLLPQCVFVFHPTVWAKIRVQKDGAVYVLPQAGAASEGILRMNPTGGTLKVAGEMLGFPVFTSTHLPAFSATAVSTKFGIFGSLRAAIALGLGDGLVMEDFRSGNFGGKEVALSNQRGVVARDDHAVTIAQPGAVVTVTTAAS